MKKIISLIILSLIFKGYVCEGEATCEKEGTGCKGGEAGKTVCVLEGDECKLKPLCTKVEPTKEDDCTGAPTTDDKKYKCVFQAKGSKDQCKEVEKEATSDTTKSSEKADDTTKSSTKADEKNGANYVKLSLGLLSLLFF